MKYFLFVCAIIMTSYQLQSQEIYFKTGKNFTTYSFKDANNIASNNLHNGSGSFYEVGYLGFFGSNLDYNLGVALNEFNANGGDLANNYNWNTSYLGLQSSISYAFVKIDDFELIVRAGLNVSTIIYGNQIVDTSFHSIVENDEFKGLLLSPSLGLTANYNVSERGCISLGYNYIKSINLSNSTEEKLSFNTNQIQFGIHFSLN
jgi:hypothetical protein